MKSGNDVEEAYKNYCRARRMVKFAEKRSMEDMARYRRITVAGLEEVYPDFKERYASEHVDD